VNTNIETLVITPSPKKKVSVIFLVEALPGSLGVNVKLDEIGFKVIEIIASSQLLGKVQIGDWLISVDKVELQSLTSADRLVQYLQKNNNVQKLLRIKRIVSLPPLSALAHAARKEAEQKPNCLVGVQAAEPVPPSLMKTKRISFDERIEELKRFKEKHGHCDVSNSKSSKEYTSLGGWSSNMRYAYNRKESMKLTEDRIRRLEAIGFKWTLRNAQTKNTAVVDQQCTSNNGGYTVSTSDCSCDDYLDVNGSKAEQLVEASVEQAVNASTVVAITNGLAGVQSAVPPPIEVTKPKGKQKISFDERIEELKRFKEKHGHCDISQKSKEYTSLGGWSNNMRSGYKGKGKTKMNEDRIRRLEAIGFKWTLPSANDRSKNSFDERIEELKRFKEKHGHCYVSSRSKEYTSLGAWSRKTRSGYKGKGKMKLTEDRIHRLEAIGFKWTTTMTKSFEKDSKCDPAGGAGGTVSKEDVECLPSGDETSAVPYQNDEGVQKTVTTSVSIVQCEITKRKKQTNHNQSDRRMVSFSPGSPAFDPSRYSIEELQDAMEESKRVCREMERREAARLDEIANRLFESDDDDSEHNSDEDSADGPNDDDEEYIAT